jgi:hypothetical protein
MLIRQCFALGDTLTLNVSNAEAEAFINEFKEGEYEIKPLRRKRSIDANNYCWLLCSKIADTLGITKEEVYRKNIREGAEYTPLPIKADAVEDFQRIWAAHGIGWFAEVVDDSKIPGYKLVFAYHGSSQYDTAQMSRLINAVVQDAKATNVETLSEAEIESMLTTWKENNNTKEI